MNQHKIQLEIAIDSSANVSNFKKKYFTSKNNNKKFDLEMALKNHSYNELPNITQELTKNSSDKKTLEISQINIQDLNNKIEINTGTNQTKERNISDNSDKQETLENPYCLICFIETPLRAKHCKECDHCIATFDHHCGYIANCVGEKNKKYFLIFLFVHSFEIATCIILSVFNFKNSYEIDKWFKLNILIFLCTLIASLLFTFVFSLLVFQIQIAIKNQTTCKIII